MALSLASTRHSAKLRMLGKQHPGIFAITGLTSCSHSFGSAQTYSLVNMYPNISDGIVLTGFSMNGSFVGFFGAGGDFVQANLNQPFRFGNVDTATVEAVLNMFSLTDLVAGVDPAPGLNYPNGYLTNTNVNANQYLFFLPGYFDPGALLAGEQTKQPVTIGELLTSGSLPMVNTYAGPVLVLTGCESPYDSVAITNVLTAFVANDLPYCGGNCLATGNASLPSIPAAVAMNFPMVPSSNFTAYIQPNSGHSINFHYNATGAYGVINSFLNSKGLMSS